MWGMSWQGASLREKFFLSVFFLVLLIRTPIFWLAILLAGSCVGSGYYLGHLR